MRKRLTDELNRIKIAASSGIHRQISDDFKYNKAKLKHLKRILHNLTVALGTLNSAHNEFSKVKGPDISPDGLLGGLGYIISLKDIKETLLTAIKNIGEIADCIADELTNPKWDAQDDKDVKKLIKEKEEVEERVEDIMEENPEDQIEPEDVVTSEDELDLSFLDPVKQAAITKAVKASLIRFNSNGKQS